MDPGAPFSPALSCKRLPQICQDSCFLTWFCQEDMGYGEKKIKILLLKVLMPTQILLTEKGLVAIHNRRPSRSLQSDSPQMG